jgi:16S rRNA (cytidine1402-2'-O)-methyltransferase
VGETLEDCVTAFGEARAATVVREATKLHETTYRGSLRELLDKSSTDADFSRGEIVLIIGGALQAESGDGESEAKSRLDKVLTALLAELPLKQAARLAAQITGARDNETYKRALFLKEQSASQ